jgi:hypothetical protein
MVYYPMEKDEALPRLAGHLVLGKLAPKPQSGWDLFTMLDKFFKAKVKNRLAFSAAYNKCVLPSTLTTPTHGWLTWSPCTLAACVGAGCDM